MEDEANQYDKLPQILAGLGAAMGGFHTGIALGWASGGLPLIKKVRASRGGEEEEPTIDAWIESVVNLGAIGSLIVTGFVLNSLGHKGTLLISLPLATAVWIVTALVVIDPVQIAMRVVLGFSIGIFNVVTPLYVGEIAAKEVRGTIGFFFQLLLNLGILYSYVVALTDDVIIFNMMMLVPVFVMVVWVFFLPESPYYLMNRHKEDAAKDALQKLRGSAYNIDREFEEIQNTVQKSKLTGQKALIDILRIKSHRRAVGVGILLMMCVQLSGIDPVLFNLATIFRAIAGTSDHHEVTNRALIESIIVGVVQVLGTLPAICLVDSLGRRALMLGSLCAMGVGQAMLFAYFATAEALGDDLPAMLSVLPLVGLCLFIASFAIGVGPLSTAMLGEIFSENTKNVSAPAVVIFDFLISFMVVWLYEYLNPVIPLYVFFLVYAVLCFLAMVAVFFILPETKNRTFEEIQNILEGNAPDIAPILFKN